MTACDTPSTPAVAACREFASAMDGSWPWCDQCGHDRDAHNTPDTLVSEPSPRRRPLCSSGTYDATTDRLRPWRDNAEMIAEAMQLFHPAGTPGMVADVTYGRGAWWRRTREPDVRHGLDTARSGREYDDGVDFRALPEPDGTFAVVAFDPPYTATGSPTRSADVGDMRDRFGLAAASTPAGIQTDLINPGLTEAHRVLALGGIALVKCSNYVSGGKLWPGEFLTLQHAASLDMALLASYTFVSHPGPQPHRRGKTGEVRPQQHPRNNTSALFVLQRTRPITGQGRLL